MFNVYKEFFNVGKEQLHTIVEEISLYNYKETTISNCKNCPFVNNDDENVKKYCNEYCTHKNEVHRIAIPKFKNIKHYKLTKSSELKAYTFSSSDSLANFRLRKIVNNKISLRLSSSQIKQMITYYYLANSKGYVGNIKKKYIAKLINCSIKTIENNNKLLESLNFIITGRHSNGAFSLIINNYKSQYAKDSSGYAVLSKTLFREILNADNVNSLRLLIQAIIKNDMNSVFNRETTFSMRELNLKQLLPAHINYVGAVENIISKLTDNVKAVVLHNNIVFSFSKKCNAKALRKEKFIEYTTYFENYIEEYKIKIVNLPEQIESIINLCFEYGFSNVKQCFNDISDQQFNVIENLGGYIRDKIRKFIPLYSENLISS